MDPLRPDFEVAVGCQQENVFCDFKYTAIK